MSDIDLKFVIALARAYNMVFSEIEKNVQGYGLNISEFGVLEMLLNKGEQPVQKVAAKILVTSGTITYVIDKLQKKGLVYRKKCTKDKRIFYVCLTKEGEDFISGIFIEHKKFLKELFCTLSEDVKREVVSQLFMITDKIKDEITSYESE